MRYAVTGATGHLGAHVVRRLLLDGHEVRALTIEPTDASVPALNGLELERVQADVRDPVATSRAIERSDVVIHLAARISIVGWESDAVWETNVEGTRNVVEACLQHNVRRLVHVSSIHALDPSPGRLAVMEDRGPSVHRGLAAYDRSKAAGEQLVIESAERGLHAVILNPTGMIGPLDTGPSLIGRVLIDVWRERLPVVVQGGMNWVDVRDVASTVVAAARQGRAGARYLVGGSWVRTAELARLAADVAGVRPPTYVAPMWLARFAAGFASGWYRVARRSPRFTRQALLALERYRLVLDTPATEELGHRARPIEQTLQDTYDWFVRTGSIETTTENAAVRSSANAVPTV